MPKTAKSIQCWLNVLTVHEIYQCSYVERLKTLGSVSGSHQRWNDFQMANRKCNYLILKKEQICRLATRVTTKPAAWISWDCLNESWHSSSSNINLSWVNPAPTQVADSPLNGIPDVRGIHFLTWFCAHTTDVDVLQVPTIQTLFLWIYLSFHSSL